MVAWGPSPNVAPPLNAFIVTCHMKNILSRHLKLTSYIMLDVNFRSFLFVLCERFEEVKLINELSCKYGEKCVTICFFFFILLAAIFNVEDDIGTYTIRAVDDPRTLNKILYLRPPKNIYSYNELVALSEKKIGKTLEKIYVLEEKILKDIQGQWENPS
jgi:hypothetical protein